MQNCPSVRIARKARKARKSRKTGNETEADKKGRQEVEQGERRASDRRNKAKKWDTSSNVNDTKTEAEMFRYRS